MIEEEEERGIHPPVDDTLRMKMLQSQNYLTQVKTTHIHTPL